jgi:hypothetical protein
LYQLNCALALKQWPCNLAAAEHVNTENFRSNFIALPLSIALHETALIVYCML